jgi:Integrase core domain
VLVRCRVNRLSHVDRRTGDPSRYEHGHPGAMLHVDVKKLGNIPDGGGWRYHGRAQGNRNRHRHSPGRSPTIGTAFVHTVIDDHSRVAYAEIHDDETAATAITVLRRAVAWFAARGVTVERVCPTTAPPTDPTPGATPAPNSGSDPRRPGPTGPRRTRKSNASTATSPPAGPSSGCSRPKPTAARHYRAGSTSTTITGPTPRSATTHPSPA